MTALFVRHLPKCWKQVKMKLPDKTYAPRARQKLSPLLRLEDVIKLGPVPICKSTWQQGVREGRHPSPVKIGARITAWRSSDIEKLIANGLTSSEGGDD